jgi:hypothetical protein
MSATSGSEACFVGQIPRDRAFRDDQAEFQQLAVDPGSAPETILRGHTPNEDSTGPERHRPLIRPRCSTVSRERSLRSPASPPLTPPARGVRQHLSMAPLKLGLCECFEGVGEAGEP